MFTLATGLPALILWSMFYSNVFLPKIPTFTPETIEEVKQYLCMTKNNIRCLDEEPRKIIINKVFDFTTTEGTRTELGCYHLTNPPICLTAGQLKLNVSNQCNGLTLTNITYNVAGLEGVLVGSNKIIIGVNGGGFKGKGLRLIESENVEIKYLSITDINPQLIWGGDAIELSHVKNVLIDGNYIKNIGRQMIVTHYGGSTGLAISNNVFDGNTPYAAYCDGSHYWLWLFAGTGDIIILQNNVIINTCGRGPDLAAQGNGTSFLHMIGNKFYNIGQTGLVDVRDKRSSVLVEGNVFVNVTEVIHNANGYIFMPQSYEDQMACVQWLGRPCLLNTEISSGGSSRNNSLKVLQDFQNIFMQGAPIWRGKFI